MAESKTKLSQRLEGLKSEFKKIAWPEPKAVGKQSTAVLIVSVVLAIIIVLIDMVVRQGIDFLVNF